MLVPCYLRGFETSMPAASHYLTKAQDLFQFEELIDCSFNPLELKKVVNVTTRRKGTVVPRLPMGKHVMTTQRLRRISGCWRLSQKIQAPSFQPYLELSNDCLTSIIRINDGSWQMAVEDVASPSCYRRQVYIHPVSQ